MSPRHFPALVARPCLKQCQAYLFPHCPTALASPLKGTEINCKLMVIRAAPTPMLISTRKSILCLEERAMESPFLLVLLSALPLSALGCSYGLVPWVEKNMENQIKQPLLPAFFPCHSCSLSFILAESGLEAIGLLAVARQKMQVWQRTAAAPRACCW